MHRRACRSAILEIFLHLLKSCEKGEMRRNFLYYKYIFMPISLYLNFECRTFTRNINSVFLHCGIATFTQMKKERKKNLLLLFPPLIIIIN